MKNSKTISAVIPDNRPYLELMVSLKACRNKFQFLIAVYDDLQTLTSVINQCDRDPAAPRISQPPLLQELPFWGKLALLKIEGQKDERQRAKIFRLATPTASF